MSFGRFCLVLVALVPVFLGLAAAVPPFDDELYYWCWSRDLQLSYYDHPPMVAYLIRASTAVFGDNFVAIRLPAVVSGLTVVGVIGWLSRTRDLLPLIYLSPVLTFAAIMVTPDTPMLMFWALYLAWLVAIHERLARTPAMNPAAHETTNSASGDAHPRRPGTTLWLLGGLILGCGVLGKYTMGLVAITGGVSFLFAGNWRRWMPGYVLHAIVSFAVASPILIHNLQHDFVPIRYQWGHSMGSPAPGFVPFAEFVGVQILLLGTLPFVVFVWSLRHRRELLADPRLRVCLCLFVLPFAFFLFKATRGRLEGNWAFPCYIACWPLAAVWYDRVKAARPWRIATRAAFALPVGTTVVLTIHMIQPLAIFPVSVDRGTRQWGRLDAARAAADDLRTAGHAGPVYAPTYQWVSLLRWYGVDARQIDGASRPSHFTTPPESPAGLARAVVCSEELLPLSFAAGFGEPRKVASYPVRVRGTVYQELWWIEYAKPASVPLKKPRAARLDPARAEATP